MNEGVQNRGAKRLLRRSNMRGICLLLLGAALVSCTTAPPDPMRSAKSTQRYAELLAGKVARPAQNCLPHYNMNDMAVIDDSTVVFGRSLGGGTVYVAHMRGPCSGLSAAGPNALVTRQVGASGLCSGDIADVVDTMAHITVGNCSFGEFVPYVRP
jgi:hypothetical protein